MYSQPLGEGGGARPIVKEDGLAIRLLLKPWRESAGSQRNTSSLNRAGVITDHRMTTTRLLTMNATSEFADFAG